MRITADIIEEDGASECAKTASVCPKKAQDLHAESILFGNVDEHEYSNARRAADFQETEDIKSYEIFRKQYKKHSETYRDICTRFKNLRISGEQLEDPFSPLWDPWIQHSPIPEMNSLGRLLQEWDSMDLYELFCGFGRVIECRVSDDNKGYVLMGSQDQAKRAVDELNNSVVGDVKLSCEILPQPFNKRIVTLAKVDIKSQSPRKFGVPEVLREKSRNKRSNRPCSTFAEYLEDLENSHDNARADEKIDTPIQAKGAISKMKKFEPIIDDYYSYTDTEKLYPPIRPKGSALKLKKFEPDIDDCCSYIDTEFYIKLEDLPKSKKRETQGDLTQVPKNNVERHSINLAELFSSFGKVLECKSLENDEFHLLISTTQERAKDALGCLHGCVVKGIKLKVERVRWHVKNLRNTCLVERVKPPNHSLKSYSQTKSKHTGKILMADQLYIKNLPEGCTKDDLENVFSKYGKVVDILISLHNSAHVIMNTAEQTKEAVKKLNNYNIKGSCISVEFYVQGYHDVKRENQDITEYLGLPFCGSNDLKNEVEFFAECPKVPFYEDELYVKNFSAGCTKSDLENLFSKYGKVDHVLISSNCAHVVMNTRAQAEEAAKKLNNYNLKGSCISVQFYVDGFHALTEVENVEERSHGPYGFFLIDEMNEAKASSSKGKSDPESPSPWMMEYLLKMKQEIKEEILEELTNLPRIEMQGHCAPNGKVDENQYQGEVIHPGIFCDSCDQLIHGIRYKCGNCTDYDLCQECESLPNIHNKNHIFLKIRFPVSLKLFQKQKWQPFVLPSATELLTPNFKSHSPKKLYEAKFVCDETVPDGTILAPSTRFIKSWRVLNSGKRVWTHSTKLQHIQGSVGLTPASEQADVPHLRPGEEGIVSVLFTTPAVPGVYRSHWNFCHKSRPFGHIVWCHIVVKDPEPEEKQVEITSEELNLPPKGLPSEKEKEVASIAKVLTAVKEEHERGNMIPRKLAVNSHTATPNNTPFDLTPPKSPDHQAMNELKVVVEDKESVPSLPVVESDAEEGSVVSLSSSDSDAEFVVIPMPNCFNLSESFASHNVSHLSQYLQSENVGDQKDSKPSVPKVAKPQNLHSVSVKPTFSAETVSQETGVPELSEHSASQSEVRKDSEQQVVISHNVSADGSSSSEISIIESGENSPISENSMPISSIHIAVTTNDAESKTSGELVLEERRNSLQQQVPERDDQTADIPGSSATFPKFPVEGITSIYEPASSVNTEEQTVQVLPERIVTVPLNVASTVYNATMQVMTNLRRQYADAQNNQEGATGVTRSALSPIDQLVEMGFCNRQQNEELLKKHKNDVALVVGELVNMNDNEWYASRHVPPSAPTYN